MDERDELGAILLARPSLEERLAEEVRRLRLALEVELWLGPHGGLPALPESLVFDRHGNRVGSIGEDGIIDVG